jgi:hypothetical protein
MQYGNIIKRIEKSTRKSEGLVILNGKITAQNRTPKNIHKKNAASKGKGTYPRYALVFDS